ncbi:MAG: IclR family transcriptional regulator [Burkholderiaceae bacterium]
MNNTLEDGLRIMDYLAYAERPMSLTEISTSLELGKSKTHRLLRTLIQANFVFQNDGSKYIASIKLWKLGSAMLRHTTLRSVAESEMQNLMEHTGESVHLSVLEDLEIVYLHKIDSDHPVRAYSQIGGRMPAFQVATGKAMLAFKSDDALKAIYRDSLTKGFTTRKTEVQFLEEMRGVRETRVAVNHGEYRIGVHGVAVPIVDRQACVVAALGVSGPAHRFGARRVDVMTKAIKQSAGVIAEKLFGSSPDIPWHRFD